MGISKLISRRRRTISINGVEYKAKEAREFLTEVSLALFQLEEIERNDQRKPENHPLAVRLRVTPDHKNWKSIKPLIQSLKVEERRLSRATYTGIELPVKTTRRISGVRVQKLTERIKDSAKN